MEELPWLIFNRLFDLTLLKDPLFTWLYSFKEAMKTSTHTHTRTSTHTVMQV